MRMLTCLVIRLDAIVCNADASTGGMTMLLGRMLG